MYNPILKNNACHPITLNIDQKVCLKYTQIPKPCGKGISKNNTLLIKLFFNFIMQFSNSIHIILEIHVVDPDAGTVEFVFSWQINTRLKLL